MEKFDEKFQDPKTGETVTRLKIPAELLTGIEKSINENGQSANNFMQFARMAVVNIKNLMAEFDKATKAEQDTGKEVLRIREKMKLDSSWIYNIPLKMMEKREAPPETRIVEGGVNPAPKA